MAKVPVPSSKICKKCFKRKDISEFNSDPRMADLHKSECRQCNQEYHRNYRKQNHESEKMRDRVRYQRDKKKKS